MTEEQTQVEDKPTQPTLKSTNQRIDELEARLQKLTHAIRQSAHVMGWPKDLLERQGIKAFDKKTEKLEVNGR